MSRLKSVLENAEEEEGHPQQPTPLFRGGWLKATPKPSPHKAGGTNKFVFLFWI
jgi:hypothetical protein